MSLKIRLARHGAKKKPFYRIVIADSRFKRDGRFIEKVGTYDPMLPCDSERRVTLLDDRIRYWLGTGALPTERVESFLVKAGLFVRSSQRIAVLENRKRLVEERKAAKSDAETAAVSAG